MFVVILGRRKRTEKFELQGCRRSRSSHCQEPLAGASRVFPDITPFVRGSELKGAQGEQKLKLHAKESDKSKLRERRRHERRRLICANGCWGGLFVVAVCLCMEKSSRTRKELNCNE